VAEHGSPDRFIPWHPLVFSMHRPFLVNAPDAL